MTPLSLLLRERTATAHHEAEQSPFLLALAKGRVTRGGVIGLLQRLLQVYDELEALAPHWVADAEVGPLLVPGLERAPSLREDLRRLGGTPSTSSPAAWAYAERVRCTGASSGPSYLAHHYTRYLGDLSGGQVVGHAVKRAYRARLDTLGWDEAQREEAVREATRAFRLNQEVAAELEHEIVVAA